MVVPAVRYLQKTPTCTQPPGLLFQRTEPFPCAGTFALTQGRRTACTRWINATRVPDTDRLFKIDDLTSCARSRSFLFLEDCHVPFQYFGGFCHPAGAAC